MSSYGWYGDRRDRERQADHQRRLAALRHLTPPERARYAALRAEGLSMDAALAALTEHPEAVEAAVRELE